LDGHAPAAREIARYRECCISIISWITFVLRETSRQFSLIALAQMTASGSLSPYSCRSVLSDVRDGPSRLASFLADSATEVRDAFGGEALAAATGLMSKYADVPMDFPDATLVWIAESSGTDRILTLDRRGFTSFRYQKNRRFKLLLEL
jgi:predicted nucleic acid-binding protein